MVGIIIVYGENMISMEIWFMEYGGYLQFQRSVMRNQSRSTYKRPDYNGGLTQCCDDSAMQNWKYKMNSYLNVSQYCMHMASNRLCVILRARNLTSCISVFIFIYR